MLKIETTGKHVENAIENALFELKATREDVDITILDEGGFLRKARVSVKISDDCMEKYLKLHANELVEEEEKKPQAVAPVGAKVAAEESKPPREKRVSENSGKASETFMKGLLEVLNLKGDIELNLNGKDIYVDVTGENLSPLIGHRGETMYAVQFLLSILESREDRNAGRVLLNVDHYKEHREVQLTELAQRQADKCKRYGKTIKMEPMNSYERKIVHTALQNDSEVETHSEGEEPHRYLVISPKKQSE